MQKRHPGKSWQYQKTLSPDEMDQCNLAVAVAVAVVGVPMAAAGAVVMEAAAAAAAR